MASNCHLFLIEMITHITAKKKISKKQTFHYTLKKVVRANRDSLQHLDSSQNTGNLCLTVIISLADVERMFFSFRLI